MSKYDNWDDMEDFDEDEFFADFSKMTGGDLDEDPSEKKGIKSFFKNVVKSLGRGTAKIGKVFMPEAIETISSFGDIGRETKDSLADVKTKMMKELRQNFKTSGDVKLSKAVSDKLAEAKKDVFERVTTGNFIKAEKGIDFNFDDEDEEESSDDEEDEDAEQEYYEEKEEFLSEFGELDKFKATAMPKDSEKQQIKQNLVIKKVNTGNNRVAKATLSAAEASISAQEQLFSKAQLMAESRHNQKMAYIRNIAKNVYASSASSAVYAKMFLEYGKKHLAMVADSLALAKEMHQYQTKLYAKTLGEADAFGNPTGPTAASIFGGGGFFASDYFEAVKNNITNTIRDSMIGQLYEQGVMMNEMMEGMGGKKKGTIGNILGMINPAELLIRGMFGEQAKLGFETLNKFGKAIPAMLNQKLVKMSGKGGFLGLIGEMLGIRDTSGSLSFTAKASQRNLKDPAIWDQKSWITLNEIIPGYLSTMTAALTGQEQTYYDHETLEFKTVSSMEKRYKQEMEYAYYSDYDIQDRMMEITGKAIQEGKETGLTPAQIKDGIDKIYKKLVDIGLEFEPSRVTIDKEYGEKLTEYVKGTEAEKSYLLKQFVKAFNEMTGAQKAQFNLGIAVTQAEVSQARKFYSDKAFDSGNAMYVKKFEDANYSKSLEALIKETENKLKGKNADDMSVIPLKKKLAQLKRELYNEKMGSVDLLNKEDTNIEDEELRTMGVSMNSSVGILKKMLKMMSVGLPVFVIKKNKKTLEEYKMLRTFFSQTEKDIKDKKMIEELQNEELGQSALDTSERLSQEIRAKYYSKVNTGFGRTKLGYTLNSLGGGFTTLGMQTLGKLFSYDFKDMNFMTKDLKQQKLDEMFGKFDFPDGFGQSLANNGTIEAAYEEISTLETVFPFGSSEDRKLENIKKRLKEVAIDNTQLLHDAYLNRADPNYAEKVEAELAKIKEEIIDLMAERDYLDEKGNRNKKPEKKEGDKDKKEEKVKADYVFGINAIKDIVWKNEEMDKKLANTRNEKGENFLKSISKADLKPMVATILDKSIDNPKIKNMKVDEMRSIVSKYFNKEVSKNADIIKEFGDEKIKISSEFDKEEMDYSGHGLTEEDLRQLAIAEFQRRTRMNFYEDLKIAEAYTTFTDEEVKNIQYAESVIITMREAFPDNWWLKLDRNEILNCLYPGMKSKISKMSATAKNEMLKQYARERIDPDTIDEKLFAEQEAEAAKLKAEEEAEIAKRKEEDDKHWAEVNEKRRTLWLEDIQRREEHDKKVAEAPKGTKVEKYKSTDEFKEIFGNMKRKNGRFGKWGKKIMDMGYDQVTYIKKTDRNDTIGTVLILANMREALYILKKISDAWAFGSEFDMFACNAVYISPEYIDMLGSEYSPLDNAPNFSETELEMLVSENRIKVFTDPDLLLNWTEKNDPMNIQESIEMVQKQEKRYSIREQKRIDAIRKAKSNLKERAIKRLEDRQYGPYLSDEVINKEMDKIKEEDKEKSKIKKKTKSTSLYDILLATLSIKNTLKKGFSRMTNLREEAFDDTKTGSLESLVDDIETAKSNINMGVSAQKDGPEKFINKELTLLEEMNLSLKLLASSKVIEDADGDEDGSFLEWLKGAPGKAYNKVRKLFSSTASKKSKKAKKKRGRKKKEEKGLIATILGDLSDLMGEIFGPAWEKVKEFGGGIKDFLFGEGSVGEKIGKGAGWAKDRLFDLLGLGKDVAGKVVGGGLDVAGKAVDKGKDILFGIKEGVIKWKNDKLDPKLAELGEKYGKKFLYKLKKEELKVIVASILKLDPDDPQIKSMKVAELREIAENYYEENILPKIEEFKSKGSDMLSNAKEKGKGLIGKLGEMLSGALGLGADGLSTILGTVSGALSDLNLGEAISNFRPFGGGGGSPVYTRAILQNVIAMRLILAREFGSVDMNKIDKSIDQLDTSASKNGGKSGFFKTMGKIFGNAFTAIVGAPGKAIDLWKNAREARKRGEISETEQKLRDKIGEIGHDLQIKGKKARDLAVHKAGELKDKASKKAEELDIKGKAKKAKDKVKELAVTGKDKISELATNSMERFKDLNKFLGDLGKKFGRIFVYGLSPRQMRIATAMILDMDPTDKALDDYPINLMREIVLNHYVNNVLPHIKEKKIKLSEEDKKELEQADKDTTKYKLTADGTDVEAKKKRGRPKKGTGSADLADGFTASEHGDHIREGSRADMLLDKAKAKAEKLQEKTAELLETIAVNTGLSTKLQKEGNKINKDNGKKMDENNNDEDGDGGILGFLGSFVGDSILDRFFGGGKKGKGKRRRGRPRGKSKSKWGKKLKSIFKKGKKGKKAGKFFKKGGKFLNKAGKIGAIAGLGAAGLNILTGRGSVEDVMEVAESGKDVAMSAGKEAAKQAGKKAAKDKAKKSLFSKLFKQGGKQAAKSGGRSFTRTMLKGAVAVGKVGGKVALGTAKVAGKVGLGLADKIAKLFGILLSKFFQNPAIAKKVGNKAVSGITKAIIASVKKIAGPTLAKLGAKIGALMGMIGSGVGALPGVVWKIADATLGFFNGMKNANKFWGVGATTKLTAGMKIATGLVGAIDGLLWGVLSITGAFLGSSMNGGEGLGYWIQLVYKLLGGNTDAVDKAQNFAKLRAEVYGIQDVQAFVAFEKAWFKTAGRMAKLLGFKDKKAYEYWYEKRYKPLRDLEDQIINQFGDKKTLESLDDDDEHGEARSKYRKAFLDAAKKYVRDNKIGWLVSGMDMKTIEAKEKEMENMPDPNAQKEGEEDNPGSKSDAEKIIANAGKDNATSIANSMNPNATGNVKNYNSSVSNSDINNQNTYHLPKATVDYNNSTSGNHYAPGQVTKREVGTGTQAKPLPESLKTAAGRIELILRNEGGYCNYKEDKGGPTNYGIAWNYNKAELAKYGITNPEQMKTLDKNIAIQIYYNKYYKPSGADSITDPVLAVHVFDVAVNSGVGRAKEFLAEAKKHPNPRDYFIQRRYNYYRALVKKNPQYQRFERGWLNRIKHTNEALGYIYSEGSYVDSTSTSTSTSSSASYTPGTNPNTHATGNVSNVELNNNSGLSSSDTNAVEALNKLANSTSGPTPSDVASGTGDSSLMGYNGSTLNKTGAKGSVTKGAAQNFEEAVTTELQILEKILEGQKQQTQAIVTPLAALQATMVQCAQLLNQIANQLGNSGGLGNVTGSIASGM